MTPRHTTPADDRTGLVAGPDGLRRPPWANRNDLLRAYYDTEWGMPVIDEIGMFDTLAMEVFVCGLGWGYVLSKRDSLREAFDGFVPDRLAAYDADDVARLLDDPGVIRNRRKIEAVIANARATVGLREEGGLAELVWAHQPARTPCPASLDEVPLTSEESWALASALRSRGFSFIGPVTAQALLAATGVIDLHVVGSHRRGCSGLWTKTGTRRRASARGAA